MLSNSRSLTGISLLLLGLSACDGDKGTILSLDATGTVSGTVFLDGNGDGEMTPPIDQPVAGVQVVLHQRGTSRTAGQATTGETGVFSISEVPVGRYSVSIGNQSLGDTLQVIFVDPTEVQVGADATASVTVAINRRIFTIAAARDLEGRQVSVEGFVLSPWNNFGDASLHIADETGAIRAVQVPESPVEVGTQVRMTGTIVLQEDQPVLDQPVVIPLDSISIPEPRTLTSALAATADGGALDGGLVRVGASPIIEVRSGPAGNTLVVIDDGSGELVVSLTTAADIVTEVPIAVGGTMEAAGVLVPDESEWQLRPRSSEDVALSLPTATIAEFRALPVGSLAVLDGIATTSTSDFADESVHLTDESGSLRATGITGEPISAGDRIRLVGTVGLSNGQPVLVGSTSIAPEILGSESVPGATGVNASAARSAGDGALDAALVRLGVGIVRDTATVEGERRVTIRDLSGAVELILDADAGIPANALTPNAIVLGVTGVLVPTTTEGRWYLKPRSAGDISR